MDAIVTQVQDVFEGNIDYEGQRTTEKLYTILLTLTSIFAFTVGYIQRDIHLVMWTGLVGTLLTMLVVVPPWPFYNKHPLSWLGSRSKLKLPPGGVTLRTT